VGVCVFVGIVGFVGKFGDFGDRRYFGSILVFFGVFSGCVVFGVNIIQVLFLFGVF